MIGDHSLFHTLSEWVPTVGLLVLGAGYLAGTWLRGRADADRSIVEAAAEEASVMRGRADRLDKDLREAREKCAQDIARLEGVVDQLREENARLQSLVMGETVPPALQNALQVVAQENLTRYEQIITDRLHAVEQGVTRLLTERKGGEG